MTRLETLTADTIYNSDRTIAQAEEVVNQYAHCIVSIVKLPIFTSKINQVKANFYLSSPFSEILLTTQSAENIQGYFMYVAYHMDLQNFSCIKLLGSPEYSSEDIGFDYLTLPDRTEVRITWKRAFTSIAAEAKQHIFTELRALHDPV